MSSRPVLTDVFKRARKDPLASLLAAAAAAGVKFRIAGARLQIAGTAGLHPLDAALLQACQDEIRARLLPADADADLLDEWGIAVVLICDAAEARAALAGVQSKRLGFDIETCPTAPANGSGGWLKITKAGAVAKHQPRPAGRDGLDPHKARIRLSQTYDPATGVVYVVDHAAVPATVLRALKGRLLYAHNSVFEESFLRAAGIDCLTTLDTLQAARLALGSERGGLALAEVAETLLDVSVPKQSQTSDWGAPNLSVTQLRYAALDAVLAERLGEQLRRELDPDTRAAFRRGNATVPVVAEMRLVGIPFSRDIHEATIAEWEVAYATAHAEFETLTGEPVPGRGPQRSAWIEARIPDVLLGNWPRTDTEQLRLRSYDLERLAAVPEIRPLLRVEWARKRLESFGRALLELVSPDGRLRMDLKPAAAKTGRCTCSRPNLQNLPQDCRRAVVATDDRTLVTADYAQLELRVVAARSGDPVMREALAAGADLHRMTAATRLGCEPEAVSAVDRTKGKRTNFSTIYGISDAGLVAVMWAMHGIEITLEEAAALKAAFYARYPRLKPWQRETADRAQATGTLRSICGRPLRSEWEGGRLRWTQCCNFPIQSSAADVVMEAMIRAHAALAPFDARLLLQIHDELLVECAVEQAEEVAAVLTRAMVDAWVAVFPDEPTLNLVDTATRPCWAKE